MLYYHIILDGLRYNINNRRISTSEYAMTPLRPMILSSLLLGCALPALADVPRVVTDMPITASLVQQVMGDLGTPDLLLDRGADPHHFQMRPDQARQLSQADLLVWIGPEMTPWLERATDSLAADATSLLLLAVPQTHRRTYAENAAHDHGHDDEHGHDEDHDEGHDEHADEHGHDHSGIDPHAWLDPENGRLWLDAIARSLSAADPENADSYAANAARARDDIAALDTELRADLAPLADKRFAVFHDAYGYFIQHFGLSPAIAVSLGDASTPSAGRLSAIRDQIVTEAAICAFPEANHDPRLIATAIEGSSAKLGAALDPSGSAHTPSPELYAQTLRGLAQALTDCLGST